MQARIIALCGITPQSRVIAFSNFIKSSLVSLSNHRSMSSRVAVCQMLAKNDVEENFQQVADLVAKAKEQRAQVSCIVIDSRRPST